MKRNVKAGKVQILTPEHFSEHAIGENVIAGNAMSRRVGSPDPRSGDFKLLLGRYPVATL